MCTYDKNEVKRAADSIHVTSRYIYSMPPTDTHKMMPILDGIHIGWIDSKPAFLREPMYSFSATAEAMYKYFLKSETPPILYVISLNRAAMKKDLLMMEFVIAHELAHILNGDLDNPAYLEYQNNIRMLTLMEPESEILADVGAILLLGISYTQYAKIIKKIEYWNFRKHHGDTRSFFERGLTSYTRGKNRLMRVKEFMDEKWKIPSGVSCNSYSNRIIDIRLASNTLKTEFEQKVPPISRNFL